MRENRTMQEHDEGRSSESRQEPDHTDLVRRLDRLSNADAQRVLERAIRIQADTGEPGGLTRDQIAKIAAELGVGADALNRAYDEEVEHRQPTPRGRSWLVPQAFSERTLVAGTEGDVAHRIISWMEGEEGLRPVARTGDGMLWEPDSHWTTSTRLALGTDATKALRGLPSIRHRQLSLGQDRQVVDVEVDAGRVKVVAISVGAGLAAAGAATGIGVAAATAGNDLVAVLAGIGGGAGLGLGTAVTIARAWGASIRKGIDRALSGIAHPELHPRALRRLQRRQERNGPRSGLRRAVDAISDALDDYRDA